MIIVKRVLLVIIGIAGAAMAVSAATASSDWNLTQKKVEEKFGRK